MKFIKLLASVAVVAAFTMNTVQAQSQPHYEDDGSYTYGGPMNSGSTNSGSGNGDYLVKY